MTIQIPPRFHQAWTKSGSFAKFEKVLLFGPPKSGKSRLASGFPKPIIAIDCEFGIQPYLSEADGDVCLHSTDPNTICEMLLWACEEANKGNAATIVADSGTVWWSQTKDVGIAALQARGQEEPTFQNWQFIKRPVKKALPYLMAVSANVVITAWNREFAMEQDNTGPIKKTQVKRQDVPDLERHFGFAFDLSYLLEQELDARNRPNGEFKIIFIGGRIPPTVPVGMLYPGKAWKFSAKPDKYKTPKEVYEEVVGWLRPYREKGGEPRMLTTQPPEVIIQAWLDLEKECQNEVMGTFVRLLAGIGSLEDYEKQDFKQKLQELAGRMNNDDRLIAQGYVTKRKKELGGE